MNLLPSGIELEKLIDSEINKAIPEGRRFKGRLHPYVSIPNKHVVEVLIKASENNKLQHKVGITASAAGFFACQGRFVFAENQPTIEALDSVLTKVGVDGVKVENFEMGVGYFHGKMPRQFLRKKCYSKNWTEKKENLKYEKDNFIVWRIRS